MKRMTEEYGKTVEEAIRKGLETLKVSRDDVKIVVIDEPSKGMLGMLSSKMAKVRAGKSYKNFLCTVQLLLNCVCVCVCRWP